MSGLYFFYSVWYFVFRIFILSGLEVITLYNKICDVVIITNHARKRLIERANEFQIEIPDNLENYLREILQNSFRVKTKEFFIYDLMYYNVNSFCFRAQKINDWYFVSIKEENCLKIVTFIRKGNFEEPLPKTIIARYYNGRQIELKEKKKKGKIKNIYFPFPKFNNLIIRNFC